MNCAKVYLNSVKVCDIYVEVFVNYVIACEQCENCDKVCVNYVKVCELCQSVCELGHSL